MRRGLWGVALLAGLVVCADGLAQQAMTPATASSFLTGVSPGERVYKYAAPPPAAPKKKFNLFGLFSRKKTPGFAPPQAPVVAPMGTIPGAVAPSALQPAAPGRLGG